MKLFHLSDLHIGKMLNGYSLRESQKNAFLQILKYAEEEKPDAILICGDIYDKSVPAGEAYTPFDWYAACQLSLTLGCETGRCLQAVAESLKRQRLLDDLRSNAFAMPKATVKLLMALPLLTVLLGEGMGAHSLAFLVSGVKGLACLGFALCCYTFGLIWIRALMRQDDMKGAM